MTYSIDPVVRSLKVGEEIIYNPEPDKWKDVSDNRLKAYNPFVIDEVVSEWFQRVTEVAVPYPLDTPEYREWEDRNKQHNLLMKILAEELRDVLKVKLRVGG